MAQSTQVGGYRRGMSPGLLSVSRWVSLRFRLGVGGTSMCRHRSGSGGNEGRVEMSLEPASLSVLDAEGVGECHIGGGGLGSGV